MKTARKAVQLLRQFSRNEPELGVRDLARRLDMDSASVHRLLRALLAERFVEQDAATRRYRLGFGVVDLAAVRISQHGLLGIASPHLEQLRDETGETVALLVADHMEAVCRASAWPPGGRPMRSPRSGRAGSVPRSGWRCPPPRSGL